MISRQTARLIAELCAQAFTKYHQSMSGYGGYHYSDAAGVYDFLYDNGFPAWLCNGARSACSTSSTRSVQDYFMKLHTGETQFAATNGWTWQQREQLGQKYLQQLAECVLKEWSSRGAPGQERTSQIRDCRARLELDGYAFRDGVLLAPEEDALDAKEAAGALEQLYTELGLDDSETAIHHLRLSEEHYIASRWDDSIGNSRKFLECTLSAVANRRSMAIDGAGLPQSTLSRPVRVRDYLETSELLEGKERAALDSIYGLLSETGSHPYMARSEQARLLRHLALTLGQFVMLRLRGSLTVSA